MKHAKREGISKKFSVGLWTGPPLSRAQPPPRLRGRRWGQEEGLFLKGNGFFQGQKPACYRPVRGQLLPAFRSVSTLLHILVFFSPSSPRINSPERGLLLGENQKLECLQTAAKQLWNKLPPWPQPGITQTLNSYHSCKGYKIDLVFDETSAAVSSSNRN